MAKKTLKKKIKEDLEILARCHTYILFNCTCLFSWKMVSWKDMHRSHIISRAQDGRLKYFPINAKVLSHYQHIHVRHANPTQSGVMFAKKREARYLFLEKENKRCAEHRVGTISIMEYELMISLYAKRFQAKKRQSKLQWKIWKTTYKKLWSILWKYKAFDSDIFFVHLCWYKFMDFWKHLFW